MGGSILAGDWKYYQGYGLIKDALFNLKDDPMEKKNILAEHPDRAKDLKVKLDTWLQKTSAKMPKKS